MCVSNGAIQVNNNLPELGIWISGIQNADKREQRFLVSTDVTKYFTDQSEAVSWVF